jgi:hypothetical protein
MINPAVKRTTVMPHSGANAWGSFIDVLLREGESTPEAAGVREKGVREKAEGRRPEKLSTEQRHANRHGCGRKRHALGGEALSGLVLRRMYIVLRYITDRNPI